MEDQRLQRLVVIAALLAAREEFSVGEGPGPALAESVVRVGIDAFVAVDQRDVALARRDVTAPFEDNGTQSQFDEPQRRKQAGRTGPDNHHFGVSLDIGIVEMDGSGQRLPIDENLECQVYLHLPLAGIDRSFHDPGEGDVGILDPQATGGKGRIGFRLGSLSGGQNEGNLVRHILKNDIQMYAKKPNNPLTRLCFLNFSISLSNRCGYGVIGSHVRLRI